ncbi:MAG: signal peptidase I [Ignavibacteriae bacterium]|nr:signal peptidase I [Ignavibacteriota bacterium]
MATGSLRKGTLFRMCETTSPSNRSCAANIEHMLESRIFEVIEYKWWRTVLKIALYLLILTSAFNACADRDYTLQSSSMEPTIPNGSRFNILFSAYQSNEPRRFDIVAFQPPDSDLGVWVCRIIGLPGESMAISGHGVMINGKALVLPTGLKYSPGATGGKEIKLSATAYYLLGDNTEEAIDSRILGPIERSSILGKVTNFGATKNGN